MSNKRSGVLAGILKKSSSKAQEPKNFFQLGSQERKKRKQVVSKITLVKEKDKLKIVTNDVDDESLIQAMPENNEESMLEYNEESMLENKESNNEESMLENNEDKSMNFDLQSDVMSEQDHEDVSQKKEDNHIDSAPPLKEHVAEPKHVENKKDVLSKTSEFCGLFDGYGDDEASEVPELFPELPLEFLKINKDSTSLQKVPIPDTHPSNSYRTKKNILVDSSPSQNASTEMYSSDEEENEEVKARHLKLLERNFSRGTAPDPKDLKRLVGVSKVDPSTLLEPDWTEKALTGRQEIGSKAEIVSEQMWGTGTTAGYQINRVARTKHQISFLAAEAREREEEFLDRASQGKAARNETMKKYGW